MELVKDEHVQCIRGGYIFVSVSPKLMLFKKNTGLSTTRKICRPIIGAVAAFCQMHQRRHLQKEKPAILYNKNLYLLASNIAALAQRNNILKGKVPGDDREG